MNKKKVNTKCVDTASKIKSTETEKDNAVEVKAEFEKVLTDTIDSALKHVFLQYNERLTALETENIEFTIFCTISIFFTCIYTILLLLYQCCES